MRKLAGALAWSARGFRVFPLQENGKLPAFGGTDWTAIATTDAATITAWWRDPLTGIERDYNIGVDTTGLLGIDIDNKNGKNGQANYEALGGRFDTLTVRTPTGGYHLYYDPRGEHFAGTVGERRGVADGVDVRAYHNYLVAPGSTIDGVAYEVLFDAPIVPVPEAIRPRLRPAVTERRTAAISETDTEAAIQFAREYLRQAAPAIEGEFGDNRTYWTACEVRDRGVSQETALALMLEEWNDRCEPPWDPSELRTKVESAYRTSQRGEGEKAPEASFAGVHIEPQPNPIVQPGVDAGAIPPLGNAIALSALPPRAWLVRHMLYRGEVTAMVAPGSAGKSQMALTIAAMLARGDEYVFGNYNLFKGQRLRSVIYDAEDSLNEMSRRLIATCIFWGISPDEVTPHIALWSGRDHKMMRFSKGEWPERNGDVMDLVVRFIQQNGISFFGVGPLGHLHETDENSNSAMNKVMQIIGGVARETNVSLLLGHHTAKPPGAASDGHAGNANAGRGAKAIVDNVRIALTLETMGAADWMKYASIVPEDDRERYARLDDAKTNRALRRRKPIWIKKNTVRLPQGDEVGAFEHYDLDGRVKPQDELIAEDLIHLITQSESSFLPLAECVGYVRQRYPLWQKMTVTIARDNLEQMFKAAVEVEAGRIYLSKNKQTKVLAIGHEL